MKSFKNHYNRSRFTSLSLLNNSSFENPSLNTNSFLYYNSFNQVQKDALVWSSGGNIANSTEQGCALIYGIFDFTFQLPFPSGSQCIVLQSNSFIQQSIFLNSGMYNISFMYASRSGSSLNPISISIDGVIIATTPNISVTPWTFFTQSFVVSIGKIIVVKLFGTVSSINQSTGIDDVKIS